MRYILLVTLNLPVILLAFMNFITRYMLGKISKQRFRIQFFLWFVLLVVLITSFPVYNHFSGRAAFNANSLSMFDIVQTTAIILLFYTLNNQRQKNEANERRVRELHQELSIRLSEEKSRKD